VPGINESAFNRLVDLTGGVFERPAGPPVPLGPGFGTFSRRFETGD
jgi:hypothetical protein